MKFKYFYFKVVSPDRSFTLFICDRVGLRTLKYLFYHPVNKCWIREISCHGELPDGEHVAN